MKSFVNIVTVNFDSSCATIEMLKSLRDSNEFIRKIVIIDNNSNSKQFDELHDWIEDNSWLGIDVCLVQLEDNLGYFGGLNRGLDCLSDCSDVFTIICNNDLLFERNFFVRLSEKQISRNVYALCPSVKTQDGIFQNPSMAHKPSRIRLFLYSIYYSNYTVGRALLGAWRACGRGADSRSVKDEVERPIFIGIGAIYVLTASFFEHNGHLSAPTFLYGEEAFLARQIADTGGVQLYCPALEVIHMESVSTGRIPNKKKHELTRRSFQLYKDYFS